MVLGCRDVGRGVGRQHLGICAHFPSLASLVSSFDRPTDIPLPYPKQRRSTLDQKVHGLASIRELNMTIGRFSKWRVVEPQRISCLLHDKITWHPSI